MTCELAELVPAPAAHHLLMEIIILFIVTVTSWSRIVEFLNHEVGNEVHDKPKRTVTHTS